MGAFLRQLWALSWKNLLVMFQHPVLNQMRFFIMPIAYGVFIGIAQILLIKPTYLGLGSPRPILPITDIYDGSTVLLWSASSSIATAPASTISELTPDTIIARLTDGWSDRQKGGLKRIDDPKDIQTYCPQNFNGFSECFAAIIFNSFPGSPTSSPNATTSSVSPASPTASSGASSKIAARQSFAQLEGVLAVSNAVNYTIRADGGLFRIDVRGDSDYEKRILPLQYAMDKAITELVTGSSVNMPIPLEWPFTQETQKERDLNTRLAFVKSLKNIMVLGLVIGFLGIAYTLPGAFGAERASLLTAHLKAMGLRDSARILSWLLTHSAVYLPAWIIMAVVWHARIFAGTSLGLILLLHLLLGLVLAAHGLFLAVPFGKSPQLAATASTFGALGGAILALVLSGGSGNSTGAAIIFSLILPSGFYVYAVRAIVGWELHQIPTDALKPDPDNGIRLLPILLITIFNIIVYPCLAVQLERYLYDAREPKSSSSRWWNLFSRRATAGSSESEVPLPDGIAISVRNLNKTYSPPFLRRSRGLVTAVGDLSFDVPRNGIFVLLGSNGAGKSTTLSILGGLLGRSSGDVVFYNGHGKHGQQAGRPTRGDVGIVPQKNVLFEELTCLQNLRVFAAVKAPAIAARKRAGQEEDEQEDLVQLLRDCDLEKKINEKAGTLSGGQKRKLQLAAGLVGGSSIVLVDECTSGVDPLSRRALWRTLGSVRHKRTVIFTTHFLDEADLLGDTIAVVAAPGKLVAEGTPVQLKSSLGSGYIVTVGLEVNASIISSSQAASNLLGDIQTVAPTCQKRHLESIEGGSGKIEYHLGTKDPHVVQSALQQVDNTHEGFVVRDVDVRGASLEGVFLDLMAKEDTMNQRPSDVDTEDKMDPNEKEHSTLTVPMLGSHPSDITVAAATPPTLALTSGRPRSFLQQTLTIFHKRILIARRAWLTPFLALLIAVAGSCIPQVFLKDVGPACQRRPYTPPPSESLFLTSNPWWNYLDVYDNMTAAQGQPNPNEYKLIAKPPQVLGELGVAMANVKPYGLDSESTFNDLVNSKFRNISFGGVSFGNSSAETQVTFAWEAHEPGSNAPVLLNLVNNIRLNRALNTTSRGTPATGPTLIVTDYGRFPYAAGGTLTALKWVVFFGLAMAVYPAFFSTYVARERRAGVQAMQLSNGLSNPAGLWLGHLMFDGMICVLAATAITLSFRLGSGEFYGLGYMWLILVLYGLAATLFSYCVSLVVKTPLAAFATGAGVQSLLFLLYLAAYLLVLTYAKPTDANSNITTIHFTMALISPVPSIMRAGFVSTNLFSLLCVGDVPATSNDLISIKRFGAPILYLIGQIAFYLGLLVWKDSGSLFRLVAKKARSHAAVTESNGEQGMHRRLREDVVAEAKRVAQSNDALRVIKLSKAFGGKTVVEDATFGAEEGTILALLGPNGAGKTTTFNMIRGNIVPTTGQILIQGKSVVSQARAARLALGVCPQFTAIDSQLSVAEHLIVYGRLKGLQPGSELNSNVDQILDAAGLTQYRNREASRLSGGNQRKLALAIALMGNPSVVLIDEFSSGVDARMKREMWGTLRAVSKGKAVVITTHSMEEASALANKVAILAKRMLAVGTTSELEARYATYEVHFSVRTPEEAIRAKQIMSRVPGARAAEDVATRFEVPVVRARPADGASELGITLEDLFGILAQEDLEFAVERPMLESVFLKVIREHNVEEENQSEAKKSIWTILKRFI